MTSKRKAELQRKLGMSAVPTPPEGLAERIKTNIPHDLFKEVEAERSRFGQAAAFNLRVAASILLMISSTYLIVHLLSAGGGRPWGRHPAESAGNRPGDFDLVRPATEIASVQDDGRTSTPSASPSKPSAPSPMGGVGISKKEGRQSKDIASAGSSNSVSPSVTSRPVAAIAEARRSERKESVPREARTEASEVTALIPAAAPPPSVADAISRARPAEVANAQKSAVAQVQTGIEGGRAGGPSSIPHGVAERTEGSNASARAVKEEATGGVVGGVIGGVAGGVLPAPARSDAAAVTDREPIFGIDRSSQQFARVREAIESGRRPAVNQGDLDALIRYFAGAQPARTATIALEGEVSPLPVPSSAMEQLLRISIDTPARAEDDAGNAIHDASLVVTFDATVESHRRIGGPDPVDAWETFVRSGSSRTLLWEMKLKPHVQPWQRIATAHITYKTGNRSTIQTAVREIYVRDVKRSWTAASRRHRLASLGALWGETLLANANGTEVARTAEELARQEPGDTKAGELARVAGAVFR